MNNSIPICLVSGALGNTMAVFSKKKKKNDGRKKKKMQKVTLVLLALRSHSKDFEQLGEAVGLLAEHRGQGVDTAVLVPFEQTLQGLVHVQTHCKMEKWRGRKNGWRDAAPLDTESRDC